MMAAPSAHREPNRALDQAPCALLAIDRSGVIVLANARLESMFGYGEGGLLGANIGVLVPEGLDRVETRIGGEAFRTVGLSADGRRLAVDITVGPANDVGEAFAMAMIQPASERVAAGDPGRLDAQIMSMLVDGIVDYAIFMLDLEGNVATWNAGARTIKGYAASEIIGRHFSTFFTPEDRASDRPRAILEMAAQTGRFEDEAWRVRKDGTRFLAHITIDAIRDARGHTTAFAKITRDITERRRQEELGRNAAALAHSLELQRRIAAASEAAARANQRVAETLNAVIAAAPLGLCTLNTDGLFEIWNPFCETLFGYTADEVIGQPYAKVAALLAVDGMSSITEFWPPRSAEERGEREVRRRRRDGKVLTLRISYGPIQTLGEPPVGYIYLINDLTERRLIEEQLQQALKMEAIGQLTGGIAHDFNNLLSIMIVNLQFVIEDAEPGSEILESSRTALASAVRGAALIQRLLSFARKQQLESRAIDVNAVVAEMTRLLERSLGEGIDISFTPQADLWPAMADPVQLQSALANLSTNARDAMGGGGHLVLGTANSVLDQTYVAPFADLAAGDYVMISVSDTGAGMSPDIVARAFDPFFTTKPEGEGTGLGLSMVFGFAKQSSGHVRIYSEPGIGTTVKIFLPRAADAMSPPTTASAQQARDRTGVILIVEDNETLAKAVKRMLERAGYETIVANDAAAALTIIAGPAAIDLMFTDVVLGSGMGGIELAAAAATHRPDLKILFTSGFAEKALTGAGQTTVADRLLSKPYDSEELLDRVGRSLNGEAWPVKGTG